MVPSKITFCLLQDGCNPRSDTRSCTKAVAAEYGAAQRKGRQEMTCPWGSVGQEKRINYLHTHNNLQYDPLHTYPQGYHTSILHMTLLSSILMVVHVILLFLWRNQIISSCGMHDSIFCAKTPLINPPPSADPCMQGGGFASGAYTG